MFEIQKIEKIESSLHYIKKNGFIFKYFTEFFKDIESYTPKNEILAFLCIFFYFTQMMSYLIEPFLDNLENNSTIFLFNVLYYSNFVNFFKWNNNIKTLIFAIASAFNIFMFAYFILTAVTLGMKSGKQLKSILNFIISRISFFYFWIYLIPALDVFINFFDCQNLDIEDICFQNNNFLFVFGLINFMVTIFFGFLFSYFNSEYAFLDLNKLKFTLNINFEFANLMRIAIVVIKRINNSNVFWINALAFFLLCFFLFVFYFQSYPFRNSKLKNLFLGHLFSIFLLLIVITLWQLNLLKETDILYINLPFTILAFKFSSKLNEFLKNSIFIQNDRFHLFSLEEIYQIQNDEKYSKIAIHLGFLRSHFRVCGISECKKLKKEDSMTILERFISLHLQDEITKAKKKVNSNNSFEKELLILKYLSFLADYEQNFVKAHYEVQNNIDRKETFSLFFQIALSSLKNKIKNKIKSRMKTCSLSNSNANSDKDQSFYIFFKAFKLKKKMEIEIMNLLKMKVSFLASYIKGNKNLGYLSARSSKFIPKIEKFKKKLRLLKCQKSPFYKVITMKFEIILHCLIFSNLWEGIKLEQEIFANIGNNSSQNSLYNSIFNFLDKRFLVLEVQFMNYDGILKDFSLSEKFRNFFGYKKGVKLCKNLLSYMPSFIATLHPLFIQNFLKNRKKNCSNKELKIDSYGKDSDGFIFSVSMRLGFNLDWHNQFVMFAAVTKQKNTDKIFICNPKGEIQNISKSAFEELKSEYEFLDKDDIKRLNLFLFIPKLVEIIDQIKANEKKNSNDQKRLSLFSAMHFPQNIDKILKLSKKKKFKKEETESVPEDFQSRAEQRILKDCYKQEYDNITIKDSTSYLNTKSHTSKGVILHEENPPRTANIFFNLTFFKHAYKEKEKHTLEYFSLHIYDFKKNEPPDVFQNEDTAQINETFQKDVLKVPIEDVKILNLFSRVQQAEVLFMEKPQEKDGEINQENKIHEIRKGVGLIPKFFTEKDFNNKDYGKNKAKKTKKNTLLEFTEFNAETTHHHSHVSSTNTYSNKILLIYQSMAKLENLYPKPLKKIAFLNVLQIILALTYFACIYSIVNQYMNKFYKPFEAGLSNFCTMYSSFGNSLLVNIELEYYYKNLTQKDGNIGWNNFLGKMLYVSVTRLYKTKEYFVNVEADLSFQQKIREIIILNIDSIDFKLTHVPYLDFLERSLSKLNENIDYLKSGSGKIEEINYDRIIYLQRNYPYFLSASAAYYLSIKDEFMRSDDVIYSDITIIVICAIIISISIKLIEIILWYKYESLLKELIKIIHRCNVMEMAKIMDIINQAITHLDNSETYFFKHYGEQIIQGSTNKNLESITSAKKGKKKHSSEKNKKSSSYLFQYLFIFSIFVFSLFYFLFFFLKWKSNTDNLDALITLDSDFENLNVYSTSAIILMNLAIRENLIGNSNYEASKDIYQTKDGRLTFFKSSLSKRLLILGNLTSFSLVPAFLEAKEKLKNPRFDKILRANLCEVLIETNEFEENSYEHNKCEKLLNGAFFNGLANAENELIKSLKLDEIVILQNNQNITATKEKMQKVIYQESFHDYVFANYYLGLVQELFFKELANYYRSQLDDLILEFDHALFIFIIFLTLILFSFILFILLTLGNRFKCLATLIPMIPYERLANDDQMGFLIKQFLNNHE